MSNMEKLMHARDIWRSVPDQNFDLSQTTSVGEGTSTTSTVASALGWAIRHPDLQHPSFGLSTEGNIVRVDNMPSMAIVAMHYAEHLFDMTFTEAVLLFRAREKPLVWDSFQTPGLASWTDKQVFMRRLNVFLTPRRSGQDYSSGTTDEVPANLKNFNPGCYIYDDEKQSFSLDSSMSPWDQPRDQDRLNFLKLLQSLDSKGT